MERDAIPRLRLDDVGEERGAAELLERLVVAFARDGVEAHLRLLPLHAIGQLGEAEPIGEDQSHKRLGLGEVRVLLDWQLAPAREPVEARAPGAVDPAIGLALRLRVAGDLGRHDLVQRDVRDSEPGAGALDGWGQLLVLGGLRCGGGGGGEDLRDEHSRLGGAEDRKLDEVL